MTDLTRRDVLKFLAAAPLAEFAVSALDVERFSTMTRDALETLAERGQQYRPKQFSRAEWRTVRILVNMIIPRDERSGSATEAGVPEFMDFTLGDRESMRQWVHEGLAWLDADAQRRLSKPFADSSVTERKAILTTSRGPNARHPSCSRACDSSRVFATSRRQDSGPARWAYKTWVTSATPSRCNGPGARRRHCGSSECVTRAPSTQAPGE